MVDTMPILCLLQFIMQIMVFIAFLSDYVLQLDIAHMSKPLSVCLLSWGKKINMIGCRLFIRSTVMGGLRSPSFKCLVQAWLCTSSLLSVTWQMCMVAYLVSQFSILVLLLSLWPKFLSRRTRSLSGSPSYSEWSEGETLYVLVVRHRSQSSPSRPGLDWTSPPQMGYRPAIVLSEQSLCFYFRPCSIQWIGSVRLHDV